MTSRQAANAGFGQLIVVTNTWSLHSTKEVGRYGVTGKPYKWSSLEERIGARGYNPNKPSTPVYSARQVRITWQFPVLRSGVGLSSWLCVLFLT